MSAEDLDKLFRDKLNQKSVAPSNEAWERLQARLQPPVQEEKRPVMWYYSAAAAVTMLVTVGLWTANQENNPLQPAGTVATVQQQPAAPAASLKEANAANQTETLPNEKVLQPEATELKPAASSSQKGLLAKAEPKVNRNTVAYPSSPVKRNGTTPSTKEEKKTTAKPESEMMAAVTTTKKAPVNAPDQDAPLEIIVKLDNQQGVALAQATPVVMEEEPTEDKGASRVLKGILKQVKNLKDGEKVSLSELGIAKHTFALETRIGNKTISKTIEL